jgi:hypothetical protein
VCWALLQETSLAGAIEDDFVILNTKSRWRHRLDARQAPLQFENSAAQTAKKMVVMAFVRALVSRHLPGDLDGDHPAILCKRLE